MEKDTRSILYTIVGILTAVIGHYKHDSVFWAIIDFIFWPLVWLKWLILQEVNLTMLKEAFAFFLK